MMEQAWNSWQVMKIAALAVWPLNQLTHLIFIVYKFFISLNRHLLSKAWLQCDFYLRPISEFIITVDVHTNTCLFKTKNLWFLTDSIHVIVKQKRCGFSLNKFSNLLNSSGRLTRVWWVFLHAFTPSPQKPPFIEIFSLLSLMLVL